MPKNYLDFPKNISWVKIRIAAKTLPAIQQFYPKESIIILLSVPNGNPTDFVGAVR